MAAQTPVRAHRTVLSGVKSSEDGMVRDFMATRDDGAITHKLGLGGNELELLGLDRETEPGGKVTVVVMPGDLLNDGVDIESTIFEALGAASTCWENLASAGTFDSTRCKEIGDELVKALRARGLT